MSRKHDPVTEKSVAAATKPAAAAHGDMNDLVWMDALWPLIEARARPLLPLLSLQGDA